jgi:hypothetical protein
MAWARDPKVLEIVSNLSSDLERELKALRIIGFREGDAVEPIAELKPIEDRPAELASPGREVA